MTERSKCGSVGVSPVSVLRFGSSPSGWLQIHAASVRRKRSAIRDTATNRANPLKTGDQQTKSRLLALVTAFLLSMVWLRPMPAAPQQQPSSPGGSQTPTTASPLQQSRPGPKEPSTPGKTATPRQSAAGPEQTSHSHEPGNAAGTMLGNGWIAPLIGLLGTLVGALIGWSASSWSADKVHKLTTLRERESHEHRKEAFREMLEVEIKQNLEMFNWDHNIIESCPEDVGLPQWMAGKACPAWSTTIWDSGLALWPDILSDEQRMDLQRFYILLRSLGSTRAFLTTLVMQAKDSGAYSDQRSALVQRATVLADSIRGRGNPLQNSSTTVGQRSGSHRK
jgi:hypothetical protein